jgi:DNA polymerase IV
MSSPTSTISASSPSDAESPLPGFHDLPPIFLLPTRLSPTELHDLEEQLIITGVPLTYELKEAKLVLGKVSMAKRAEFELRCRGVPTRAIDDSVQKYEKYQALRVLNDILPSKRRRLTPGEGSMAKKPFATTSSETESEGDEIQKLGESNEKTSFDNTAISSKSLDEMKTEHITEPDLRGKDMITVVRLDWLTSGIEAGEALPLSPFIVYRALVTSTRRSSDRSKSPATPPKPDVPSSPSHPLESNNQDVVTRSMLNGEIPTKVSKFSRDYIPFGTPRRREQPVGHTRSHQAAKPPHLIRQTTSEFEEKSRQDVRHLPSWVREGKRFACQRPTPLHNPNEAFIHELKKIRLTRTLTGDAIGVRAYSTSIAALAAYTLALKTTSEVLALPGCDVKIAHLFHEWKTKGRLQAAEEADNDEELKVLRLFYDIWGVGATTARDFYHHKGWRDLDDIVEFGWDTLTRVQQIGVKYYDEFLEKIPRREVENIVNIITSHARKVRDEGVECCIVGGYRRGRPESGDVDMVLSHRDMNKTVDLILDVVRSLENEGWITHTLLLATTGSQQGQQPLPFRRLTNRGSGFDTLDKALVVWQDINNPNAPEKNTNLHRRVDIIIAPWPFIGCTIAGWSGGMTFQRDLRRYAKYERNWKFDSSGIRDRTTGEVVYLGENADSMIEAERMVFEGLKLPYLDPSDRCTE